MQIRLKLSDSARTDMKEIWLHYAEISEQVADRILHRIRLKLSSLRQHPELGRPRPEFGLHGLRSVAIRPHVIFYSLSEEPVMIIHHVVDGRQNLAAMFDRE